MLPPDEAYDMICASEDRTMDTTPATYDDVLEKAQSLDVAEQLRLLEAIATTLREKLATTTMHSLTELQGLGKDIWAGIDAQAYVARERAAWNG
jgi:hypothetical protein